MKTAITFLSLFALVAALVGCNPTADPNQSAGVSDPPVVVDDMPPSVDDIHVHPVHGPHGGELVELGKEAFHLELMHAEDGFSMYVLDGSATKPVTISAEKLVVSLKNADQVATFELSANPEENDPTGQTSRFTSSDKQLDEWLDAGAEGAVVIEIDGKSYTGKIAHDHDHAGHDHADH